MSIPLTEKGMCFLGKHWVPGFALTILVLGPSFKVYGAQESGKVLVRCMFLFHCVFLQLLRGGCTKTAFSGEALELREQQVKFRVWNWEWDWDSGQRSTEDWFCWEEARSQWGGQDWAIWWLEERGLHNWYEEMLPLKTVRCRSPQKW